jgi:hypothetical protein
VAHHLDQCIWDSDYNCHHHWHRDHDRDYNQNHIYHEDEHYFMHYAYCSRGDL